MSRQKGTGKKQRKPNQYKKANLVFYPLSLSLHIYLGKGHLKAKEQ